MAQPVVDPLRILDCDTGKKLFVLSAEVDVDMITLHRLNKRRFHKVGRLVGAAGDDPTCLTETASQIANYVTEGVSNP